MTRQSVLLVAVAVMAGCASPGSTSDACPPDEPSGSCTSETVCTYGHGPACYSADYGATTCRCLEGQWSCTPVYYDCPVLDVLDSAANDLESVEVAPDEDAPDPSPDLLVLDCGGPDVDPKLFDDFDKDCVGNKGCRSWDIGNFSGGCHCTICQNENCLAAGCVR